MRSNSVAVDVRVSQDAAGLHFYQMHSDSYALLTNSSVVIEEISESTEGANNADTNLNFGEVSESAVEASNDATDIVAPPVPNVPRARRARAAAPISTSEVRRSLRANKFDGFKTHAPTDTCVASSKVKPCVMPMIGSSSNAHRIDDAVPPPTPISTLQEIGVNRCAILEDELTSEALLATSSVVSPSEN